MSSDFLYSGDCPVCGNKRSKNNCRKSLTSGMEFCRVASNPIGYVERGQDIHGCTMWVTEEEAKDSKKKSSHEREQEQKQRQEAKAKAKEEALKAELPLSERHEYHSGILNQLTLSDSHREHLRNRGLSDDQIDKIGYRSVVGGQKLKGIFPPNLPGFDITTNSLCNSEGILCPIWQNGKIAAFKIRLDKPRGKQRYSSVSASSLEGKEKVKSFHIHGDESPLAVLPGASGEIWVTEGNEIKPAIVNQLFGKTVLGGGRYWYSQPNHAAKYLTKIKELYGSRVILSPDAGDVVNIDRVPERWIEEYKFFESQGFDVSFAWWVQITKDGKDIDELEDLSIINFINLDEFEGLIKKYNPKYNSPQTTEELNAKIEPSKPAQKEESINDWAWEQWLKSRNFTPDIIMKDEYFQFPKLPNSNAMISVMASLGKGKTQAIIQEIIRAGNGVHIIGYRNNLLFQTIARAKENGLNIYHLNDDDGTDLLADSFAYLALCLDSIHKIEGYFKGRDIILDESCSVLIHALNGGTLGDNQAKAIRIISTALKECNRVFLLDGNNSDLYTNFYYSLCPDKKLIKIQNTHGSPKHNIKIVEAVSDGEIKSRNRTPLIEMLLDPEVIPWIYCDSKERTKILNQILIEGGKRGYCLNSETAGDDWAKEFLADPDKFILDKKPDYIILSPTAESGISAGDDSKKAEKKRNNGETTLTGYFTDKFTFFAGVTGTNSQLQAMFRLRDESIPHYVFCPAKSTAKDRNSPHTYSVKQYQNILNDRILQSSMLASESANNPTRALELIGNAIARTKDDWWEMSAKLGVIDNYEMDNLRKCLIYALEEAGHNVEIVQIEASEELKKAESEAKTTVQKTHAKEVHVANEFDTVEEAKQAAKVNPRKDTQRRIEKTFFLDRLPEIKDSPLWGDEFIYETHIKRKEFIRNIERYWFVKNFDVSQKRHESRWFYEATKEDFYSARVSNMTHSVIWALRELDIMKFTDGREYHKNSEDVLNLIKQLRDSKDIRTALKMESMPPATETGNENLSIISSLLNKIGFQNKSQSQKLVGGIRLRHYQAVPTGYKEELEDGEFDLIAAREDILTAIGKRFTAWMESDKSIIDWEEIVNSETVAILLSDEEAREYMIPLIIEQLQNITTKEECLELNADITEAQKRAAWNALTQDVRDRIKGLFTENRHEAHT